RPDERIANAIFICALLNQPSMERMAQELMRGETRVRISMGRLRGLEVPVPPITLQHEFAWRVTAVEALKTAQRTSLTELNALLEAGLLTDSRATLSQVESFLAQLIVRSHLLDPASIRRLCRIKVNRRAGPWFGQAQREAKITPLGQRTWLAGVAEYDRDWTA